MFASYLELKKLLKVGTMIYLLHCWPRFVICIVVYGFSLGAHGLFKRS